MTVRRFPDPPPSLEQIEAAVGRLHVRQEFDQQAKAWDYTFEPDLTAGEAAALDDAEKAAASHVSITYAEYQALKPDLDGLRMYQGLASPTAAQTAQATKAQNRVLLVLLRD